MLDINTLSQIKKPVVDKPTGIINAISVTTANVAHATAEWSAVAVKAGTMAYSMLDMCHTELLIAQMDSSIELATRLATLNSKVSTNA